jgi:hypothetical protein
MPPLTSAHTLQYSNVQQGFPEGQKVTNDAFWRIYGLDDISDEEMAIGCDLQQNGMDTFKYSNSGCKWLERSTTDADDNDQGFLSSL